MDLTDLVWVFLLGWVLLAFTMLTLWVIACELGRWVHRRRQRQQFNRRLQQLSAQQHTHQPVV